MESVSYTHLIFKADYGAIGTGGKGLAHINIETVDIGLHVLRNLHGAHICKPCRGIFILNLAVKGSHHNILQKQRDYPDKRIPGGGCIGSDIAS